MATPEGKDTITDCGEKLLRLFRAQQKTHGYKGCECKTCKTDMVTAFKVLVMQEGLPIGEENEEARKARIQRVHDELIKEGGIIPH